MEENLSNAPVRRLDIAVCGWDAAGREKTIREAIELMPKPLPAGFRFTDFDRKNCSLTEGLQRRMSSYYEKDCEEALWYRT
jgi:hypothetical protein